MTDKEFKRLSRRELIDIIYELQKQNEEKGAQIKRIQSELDDKTIKISNAGSIAEAAISLNKVFETAQSAAEQYLESVQKAAEESKAKQEEIKLQGEKLLEEAKKQAEETVSSAKEQAQNILDEAEEQSKQKWTEFESRANDLIKAHKELQNLMEGNGK